MDPRNLSGVCRRWYPVVQELHRFFIAISRAVVNNECSAGTAPDPWFGPLVPFPSGGRLCMLFAIMPCCQVLLPIWDSGWVGVLPTIVCAEDVCGWPYSVGILVKLVAFPGTLHWPAAGADLGVGGGLLCRVVHRV